VHWTGWAAPAQKQAGVRGGCTSAPAVGLMLLTRPPVKLHKTVQSCELQAPEHPRSSSPHQPSFQPHTLR
jgi:hypothetical protein